LPLENCRFLHLNHIKGNMKKKEKEEVDIDAASPAAAAVPTDFSS
jgi:hypothetical protein